MTLVADSSFVVAALVDTGPEGVWARGLLHSDGLVAPHHLLLECTSALRRLELEGVISHEVAAQAHSELLLLPVDLVPYRPLGPRVWELRNTVTPYDAWYVAVAEHLDLPLVTIDLRLTRAPGPRCRFLTPGVTS